MAEVTLLPNEGQTQPSYSTQQSSLIGQFDISTTLNSNSYIEFYVLNNNYNVLESNNFYSSYKIENDGQSALTNQGSTIIVNPINDLNDLDYTVGEYLACYKFYNREIGINGEQLYISELSSDRTEIRLDSTTLDLVSLTEQTLNFINKREESEYFVDFYLNFGNNNIFLANNIVFDNDNVDNPTVLIKLYEPLPESYGLDDVLSIVTSFEEPKVYKVVFDDPIIPEPTFPFLKGPNFNIELKDQVNNSSLSLSYEDLIKTSISSSKNQINHFLEEKEIQINIDYTNFSNYIHFSSAQTRLENFYYKASLLEQYSSSISILDSTTSSTLTLSGSKATFQSKIDEIINNFDGYDSFLYYESSSFAYPKTTNTPPYNLAPVDSTDVLTWLGSDNPSNVYYGGRVLSSSLFDENNQNSLFFAIPEYLREDPSNDPYKLFVDMVAQHYDNIWIYYRDVSQKYNADNRLKQGISKDIVADAIKDFGLKLYQNNFSNEDLYTAFLGLTPNGGLFPFPNMTGSLYVSGSEFVDQFISASNDVIPLDDVNKSLYKRIYHNIPYLLKSKGTLPGLRALITSYGIPDTILRINEFGGKDKINVNDWDHWQREFNYAYENTGSNFISSSFRLNGDWDAPNNNRPDTLAFRFKPGLLPTSSINHSASLWNGITTSGLGPSLTLIYTGSGYTSSSFSGSIQDPYSQYATLKLIQDPSNASNSASVYLPFYNDDWWSVMVKRDGTDSFTLTSANKLYKGGDNNTKLGFIASSSVASSDEGVWGSSYRSYFPFTGSIAPDGNIFLPFSGSYQEIRYYSVPLSESVFTDYVMNPNSIEGNTINSSPYNLAFRASLGGELFTGSKSIHPKVTGSWIATSSFNEGSNFYFDVRSTFVSNTEYFFADQPIAGIKNIVGDKIRVENNVIPEGNTLSPFSSLSQMSNISQSYTPGINYLEVAFSPTNEVNEDIMNQIGFFDIGEYIGDPRQRSSSAQTYSDLDNLRDDYFEKYTKNYNLKDFIRLIKFFDNSLFKMIRDFVPARTSLASGIVIKQHLLERNKYPQPQPSFTNLTISGTLKPQWDGYKTGSKSRVVNVVGGTGGVFEPFNSTTTHPLGSLGVGPNNLFSVTQSWEDAYPSLTGSVTIQHTNQDEFYDGEFSGSNITVSTQNLNPGCDKYKKVSTLGITYKGIRMYSGSIVAGTNTFYEFGEWIKDENKPTDGYISMWFQQNEDDDVPFIPNPPIDDFAPSTKVGASPPVDNPPQLPFTPERGG